MKAARTNELLSIHINMRSARYMAQPLTMKTTRPSSSLLPVARKYAPASAKDYVPSALAFGIAFIVGAYYSIAMFVGAVVFMIWKKLKPEQAAALSFAVASGLVAGEGLAGIGKALLMLAEVPTLAAMLGM